MTSVLELRPGVPHREAFEGQAALAAIRQDHVLEEGQFGQDRLDLAGEVTAAGDDHGGPGDQHARLHRLRPEGGEQRAEDRAALPGAQRRDVQFGHAAQKQKHPVAPRDAKAAQRIGKPAAGPGSVRHK